MSEPAIAAIAAFIGALFGGGVTLLAHMRDLRERRRLRLIEVYEQWIAASGLLSQAEAHAFNLKLLNLVADKSQSWLGPSMREAVDRLMSAESTEATARARVLLFEGRMKLGRVFQVAETRPLAIVEKEAQEKNKNLWELNDKFHELADGQAALRMQVAEEVHLRIGARLSA